VKYTPLEILQLQNINIYLKREDFNDTGSQKDRYIRYSIPKYVEDGNNKFVISSTGNASISALNYCISNNLYLTIFLSPKTHISKLERLFQNTDIKYTNEIEIDKEIDINDRIKLVYTNKPVSGAIQYANEHQYQLLRGSTDKYGYQGYMNIAYELIEQMKDINIENILVPCSSGSTALGIYNGFKEAKENGIITNIPRIHVLQTTSINTISRMYDKDYEPTNTSIAQAISDKVSHRYKELHQMIKDSNGFGWIISDKEIQQAQDILHKNNIYTSNESAMCIATILKAKRNNQILNNSICIFTGK